MTDSLEVRIVHSYLSHLPLELIARVEKVRVSDVERIVSKAVGIPRRELRL